MDAPDTKWSIQQNNPELSGTIARALNISHLVSRVLVNRGIDTLEQADFFLSASLRDLHSPFQMKGMHRAVERVCAAIRKREKICIYGDYDVDGITATAIMVLFLRELNAEVSWYIPGRLEEGYSLNIDALEKIRRSGVTLIITVDCGVSDCEKIAFARSQGLDVIVTDHHVPPDELPAANAIINPKQPGCDFPFKGLAGVGVAFNLIMALRKELRDQGGWQSGMEPNLKKYLDLVAMGTIADIVPMVDENRIFVRNGLGIISEGKRPGVKALKSVCGIANGEVTSSMIAYRLAPRINACGRLSNPDMALHLLLCQDSDEAFALARKIDEENTHRQQIERKILSHARKMIKTDEQLPAAIILASSAWHPGVVGLCASRLSEEFNRPTILIAVDEQSGEGRGSARSVQGFNIYNAIKLCDPLLKAFGGHKGAAGLTIPVEGIDEFKERFTGIARQEFTKGHFTPAITIDAEISLGELSYDVLEEIENLAPFGPSNPEPVFSSYELKFYSSMVVGNGHLKLKIKENGQFFDAIGFNMGSRYDLTDDKIRVAFVPQFNLFNGEKLIQLNLKDIKGV